FFSSRRRHTRWPRDWSSDVCSSDLSPSRGLLPFAGDKPRPSSAGDKPRPTTLLRALGSAGGFLDEDLELPVVLHAGRQREVGEEIGRASCRERVGRGGGEGGWKEKM